MYDDINKTFERMTEVYAQLTRLKSVHEQHEAASAADVAKMYTLAQEYYDLHAEVSKQAVVKGIRRPDATSPNPDPASPN